MTISRAACYDKQAKGNEEGDYMVTESNRGISFVIEKRLGVLSTSSNGWRKELNLVSWNERPAKLDIREWSPDHEKMAKGITLRDEEAQILQKALYRWFTGYGKPTGRSTAASEFPEAAEQSAAEEAAAEHPAAETPPLEPPAEHPAFPEYTEEPFLYEPETGEILEFPETGELPECMEGSACDVPSQYEEITES